MVPPLRHILCIDDEEDILQITRMSLETLGGFQVSICKGSGEALAQVKRLMPDVVLLDVMMPGQDGPSTLKLFQEDPDVAKIPVIFLTAKAQPSELANLIRLGAKGVISKPFNPMLLSRQVLELWKESHEFKRDQ
jgi:CheY-like chemotaxis protein